jgi:hypothetical protein
LEKGKGRLSFSRRVLEKKCVDSCNLTTIFYILLIVKDTILNINDGKGLKEEIG